MRDEARPRPWRLLLTASLAATFLWIACAAVPAAVPGEEQRAAEAQERLDRDIARLEAELRSLRTRERSLLNALEAARARARLEAAKARRAGRRLEEVESSWRELEASVHRLEAQVDRRRAYLRARLRELYKRGPELQLGGALLASRPAELLQGIRWLAYLGARDARVLRTWRNERAALLERRARLDAERRRLEAERRRAEAARRRQQQAEAELHRAVEAVRRDEAKRRAALAELERARQALGDLVREREGLPALDLDVLKFKGLLDPPVRGRLVRDFGDVVHPRFRTVVPHPGWDLEAPAGQDFRSVFDGRVVYAAWLHGYGLTVIVDHGSGVLSVYAHASVLLVEEGERVLRGQVLGKVGETGSLAGPMLYFEIRERGRPVDPAAWIRRSPAAAALAIQPEAM